MILSTDVGGTFIDFVVLEDGKIRSYKKLRSSSIKDDISREVADAEEFHHGTTVGINALIERRGSKVTLITTKGFGSLYEIGRQNRSNLYSLTPARAHLPVSQVLELDERTLHTGAIEREVSSDEIDTLSEKIAGDSVAVCLINSYANPHNETVIKNRLAQNGLQVFASAEVRREIREYERLATTVVEAYIYPVVRSYLEELRDIAPEFYVMQSNGGKIGIEHIRGVSTLMSGPAGGLAAAEYISNLLDEKNLITYDMGGTSADMGAVVNGVPLFTPQIDVDGIPVRTTSMDVISIGAGGGSIAWVDDALGLHVGPKSAGANPGPACYGHGTEFTVTDANLLLGILGEEISGVKLHRELAEKSANALGRALGLNAMQIAEGVRKIVNTNMSMAIKKISISRGYDPRDFTLLAYGGAGAMHACALAEEVGIRKIIVPPMPGAFSSLGVLLAPVRYDSSRTIYLPFSAAEHKIKSALNEFEARARAAMGECQVRTYLAMRYRGQGHEIEVPYSPDSDLQFEKLHKTMFGFTMDEDIYVIDVRFVATKTRGISLPKIAPGTNNPYAHRKIMGVDAPVFKLRDFEECAGPCVVEAPTATVFVEAGWHAQRGEYGEIIMEVLQ